MFFRRRHCSLVRLLLLMLGIKVIARSSDRSYYSDEERQAYRAKARKFRSKMREAWRVWDEDEGDAEGTDASDPSKAE